MSPKTYFELLCVAVSAVIMASVLINESFKILLKRQRPLQLLLPVRLAPQWLSDIPPPICERILLVVFVEKNFWCERLKDKDFAGELSLVIVKVKVKFALDTLWEERPTDSLLCSPLAQTRCKLRAPELEFHLCKRLTMLVKYLKNKKIASFVETHSAGYLHTVTVKIAIGFPPKHYVISIFQIVSWFRLSMMSSL